MKTPKKISEKGQSIIELLIVLVVAGILVTIAVAQLGNAKNNLQRQNLAHEFKIHLERARFDSVKRRPETIAEMASITVTSATSYTVRTDTSQDGRLTAAENQVINFGNRSNVKILGTNFIFPLTIRFNRLGQAIVVNGSNTTIPSTFIFCEGQCTATTANATNANIIAVSATGTVAMLNGGDSIPTYSNPTVTNVGTSSDVNPWVLVVNEDSVITNTTPTPTPSPNTTPTPTPTSTPTSTPTPTPTPIPTATPTQTPIINFCSSGQKPLQTGCICLLPMTVRTNGKCQ